MADPILPIIDYTSRDYQAVRADMIRMVKARIPGWTGDDNNDFGLALLEAFAYGIDGIHYYLDRTMNEAYLTTAVQRESLYSIASMFHYVPRAPQAATVELIFMNSTTENVTVPAGTQCQASIAGTSGATVKMFETLDDVVAPALSSSGERLDAPGVMAVEGQTYADQTIGTSNGYASQRYVLGHNSILPGTTTIQTLLQNSITEWVEVSDITLANPGDYAFQIERQTDGSSVVLFGNSLTGKIPELHSTINATYRVGGGTDGNVPSGSVDTIVAPTLTGISVKNTVNATGGLNAESLESIRVNAAKAFRSKDRAVTLADYESVTEAMPDVAKSKAIGNSGSSVSMYVVPNDDGTGRPLLGDLKHNIRTELLEKSMAGVSVSVFDASWVPIYLGIKIFCVSTAYQTDVERAARDRLQAFYGFDFVDFNHRVAASDIATLLTSSYGVEYLEVTRISLTPPVGGVFPPFTPVGGSTAIDTIPFTNDDLPFYRDYVLIDGALPPGTEPHLVLTMVGGIEATS